MSILRTMFREKVSIEKREKLKKFLKYEGNTNYHKPDKPYINGFLDGQSKDVIKKQILIESLHGKDINGHLFALAKELNQYTEYNVFLVTKSMDDTQKLLTQYNLHNISIIQHMTYDYGLLLATSQILINDNTFYPFFSKRNEQQYYNFWHGTPLKTLGKDIEGEFLEFGNVARNFMMTDALYLPNEYSVNKVLGSSDLEGVLKSDVYISPSPRNSLLFDKNRGENIRKDLNLKNKKIYIYMPTWRGHKKDKNINFTEENILTSLEQKLPDDVVVFYKLHSMISKNFIFNGKKVKPFPESYELYDFMSSVDGLITDYSSIMYDFASQNKKIILFTYDYEEYRVTRGMYEDIKQYPFNLTDNIEEVIEIISNNEPNDYSDFAYKFCPNDSVNGTKEIVEHILFNKPHKSIELYNNYNQKPNVYMFVGPMWDTGITAALKNLLKNIDTSKRNYILCFERKAISKAGEENILLLPPNVKIYPIEGIRILRSAEKELHNKYVKEGNSAGFSDKLTNIQNREINRVFGNNIPDYYIHYTGFEAKYSEYAVFLKNFNTKTMIYVHTDMFEDYKNKKNYNKNLVSDAWQNADKLVLVNEHLKQGFKDNFSYELDNIHIANNFLGVSRIKELLQEDFLETFQKVRFHFRNFQQSKNDLFETLNDTFINPNNSDDPIIFKAIKRFSTNPIVKYAKNSEQKKLLLQNNEMKQELHLSYVKEVYGEQIIEDFSKTIEDKKKYNNLIMSLLREDLNTSYFLRHYNTIQNYIEDHYKSKEISSPIMQDYNPEIGLKTFKDEFGLRKMEMLKELEDPNIKVFFNIGRFDQQKGHDRLIKAFEKVYEQDNNTRLYLLASYGPIKEKTLNQVRHSDAKDAITVLDRMSNPYLLLSKVDAFVLSSYYEGLGLVVYESMYVNTPVISVDLNTTTQFLQDTDIILVENSEDGLIEGMNRLINNELPTTKFNFDKYETERINEFESLFK
ncbi:CDP-glycerol glycerophosphotransferase family protein [Mammaliicoccus lentus]|uniref:CDP-glycerol glycerophosphotransferase family protein n=2 Tax=Mammaliicoccus TaxID=2803850 RepID=A0ABS6GYS9_MAMLE|nr:CDP-glycerol glycerophosphotransferase family protein [Mammaliicoccus lentus]MBU6114113.1 CDP-glycerol glycerophosphotransferase family protein [Mammaliicoccus lentus]